ncbi:MAG TPA: hypothetical protein VKA54_03250 [Gemmatimonadaceae bacterium]|nr:hypothetical protein [Gemmatimonadaceae bacterium]
MKRPAASLVAVAILALPAAARAQVGENPPIEFGADASVTALFDPGAIVLNVPVSAVRVGFFVMPRLEIEPRLNLTVAKGGGDTFTEAELTLGVLYHLTPSYSRSQTYFRPFASFSSTKFSGSDGASAVTAGIGLGVKKPIGTRFAFRPELNFAHTFADDDVEDESRVQLLLGFSVYSH